MPPKRKIVRAATSLVRPEGSPAKRQRTLDHEADTERKSQDQAQEEEQSGAIQRDFYPPEMSNERCKRYLNGDLPLPIDVLRKALAETKAQREQIQIGDAVVHWFKRDLRQTDNRALERASVKAKSQGVPLDYEAHVTSAARVDFELRTLEVLKEDLKEKGIPLYVTTIEQRKDVLGHILAKCEDWGAKHLFCNMEYEVDELRREAKLVKRGLEKGLAVEVLHDDVVVPPGVLKTGAGKHYSVYSPWFRAWTKHVHDHPHVLEPSKPPAPNPDVAIERFKGIISMPLPSAPPNKILPDAQRDHLAHLWPAGEHEARLRLERFVEQKLGKYKETRNFPAENSTAMLSVHFSAGTLAARSAVRMALTASKTSSAKEPPNLFGGWVSELAWRDFYKHVLCHWPYVCMSKPFKYEYSDIRWDYDQAKFIRWCEGKTGFPVVDAAMRQMNSMGWMHNRCRMIVASFLAKDLLIDWRLGEKYFMERLIDGDFASNNGGWGFSASTGVDPQPYFRIFNPFLQSEKFDEGGEYIRKWVPELAGVEGKAIHDPYGRGKGKEVAEAGYPRPMVEHKFARERALERYKEGLGRGTANVGGGVHN
ncbi:DNA photolyase phr1 [Recurvomyces mirabilis]|nr:DNA photolyase phr1 [Recurvomyces mirabilis]